MDQRLNPFQFGIDESTRPRTYQVKQAVVGVFQKPSPAAEKISQLVFGETIDIYQEKDGWGWGQCTHDQYVGFVFLEGLSTDLQKNTHTCDVPKTFIYTKPDYKSEKVGYLPLMGKVCVSGQEGKFSKIGDNQWVFSEHITTKEVCHMDYVKTAELLLHTPYLWGGRTFEGIDCSGLVQTCLQAACINTPRDSDQQRKAVGTEIPPEEGLARGDLVFFSGEGERHVGILYDAKTLLHANTDHMSTVLEPLDTVIERYQQRGATPTFKRLPAKMA